MATIQSLRENARELNIRGPSHRAKAQLLPPRRAHRHSGALPLLPKLKLRPLPDSYDLSHLAVLPRNPRALVVVWAIEPSRFPEQGATLVLRSGDTPLGSTPIDRPLGSWFFGGLEPGQDVWAEVMANGSSLMASSVVPMPPGAPAASTHPRLASSFIHALES